MSYTSLLNLTCTIQQKSRTQSGSGQVAFSWTTKAANVKVRRQRNLQPRIYDELLKTYVDEFKLFFLASTDIQIADRVTIGADTYQILSVGTDSQGHHVEAYAQVVRQ